MSKDGEELKYQNCQLVFKTTHSQVGVLKIKKEKCIYFYVRT